MSRNSLRDKCVCIILEQIVAWERPQTSHQVYRMREQFVYRVEVREKQNEFAIVLKFSELLN